MPNNEMDYSLIHRTPDGNGKILVTTPGSPDKGSWETEAELKTYVNQDVVMKTDIVQSLGQQLDKVPSNKCVDDAINAINTRVTNIEDTLMGENEVTVQYPDDGNYSSLMPNRVPLRALKYAEVPTIRGKSRAWNQLISVPSSSASYSGNGITFTDNGDGSYTLQTDANGATADTNIPIIPMNITQGKAILLGGAPKNSSETTHRLFFSSTGTNTYMHGGDKVYTIFGTTTRLFLQVFAGDVVTTPITFKPFIRDLNIIFPEYTTAQIVTLGTAGILSVIPSLGQYNAYDAGSLVDTVVSGAKSRDSSDNVLDTLTLSTPVTLKSAGAVAEVLTLETGKKTRLVGSVDLGSLDYSYGNTDGAYCFTSQAVGAGIKATGVYDIPNIICSKYKAESWVHNRVSSSYDKTIAIFAGDNISIQDSGYSDPATFKASMSGVYLYFELATPLSDEQVCDPISYNFLEVEGGGTVETIQTQTPVIDNCIDVTYDIIPQ